METANDTAMHVTETKTLCSSLTCTPSKSEEIIKDQEEELLCGNSEDGDEEDALSDDSMRLRLSDDEAELEEPSASADMTKKDADQDGAKMELGPDVPTIDTWEQKNVLDVQNLSNGTSTVDSKSMRVDQEDQGSNDALVDNNVLNTDDYKDASASPKLCNGDSAQMEVKSTEEAPIIQEQTKGKFAGHFGEYSIQAYRLSQSRKPYSKSNKYAADPYTDKYYNKNTHYGSIKSSGRAHNSYHRESLNRDETSGGQATPRVSSPVIAAKELEKPTITADSYEAIKSKPLTSESLDDHNPVSSNVHAESNEPDESHESVNSSNESNALSKNEENGKILSNCVNSLIPEEIPQTIDQCLNDTSIDLNVNHESSHMTVVDESEKANKDLSNTAIFAPVDFNNRTEAELDDDKRVSAEIESEPMASKALDNDEEDTEKTLGLIDEDGAPEKMDEQANMVTSDDNSALQSSVEAKVVAEELEAEETGPLLENNDANSLERAQIELAAELEKCDDPKEIDDKKIELDEPNQSESPKLDHAVEETGTSQEEKTAAPEKQCNVVTSQEALEQTAILATNDSETVEKDAVSVAKEAQILDIEAHIADLPDEKETSSEDEGVVNNVTMNSSLKRTSTESLDEMELFKRIRIQQKNSGSDQPIGNESVDEVLSTKSADAIKETDDNASTIVNPVTNSIVDDKSSLESGLINNTVVANPASESSGKSNDIEPESADSKKNVGKIDDSDVIEVPVKKSKKRTRKSLQAMRNTVISQDDTQEKENVRQKRRTAKNAEEIIRKEFLGNSDSESNDSAENFVAVNYNKSNSLRAASPPTLKRNYSEEDEKFGPSTIKKVKHDLSINGDVPMKSEAVSPAKVQALAHVRRFFRRDNNGRLAKLKQEELEELLIQKVVETITMRDEIGKLREQAKISERNQEATRQKCQQLSKQIKDFEMVLNRYQSDRRLNPEKTVVPIKINRSVGLQVNFVTDHGIQNLRQLGQIQKAVTPIVNGTSSPQQIEPSPSTVPVPKRTLKVRSPRRPEPPIAPSPGTPVLTPTHSQPIISNITPAALVVSKNVTDSRTPVTPTVQQTSVPHLIAPKQTIPVNGPVSNQAIRQAPSIQMSKTSKNDLIDLTQEEDKTKSAMVPQNTILTTAIPEATPNISNVQKIAPRYHTVIQTLPTSVAFTAQPGIRVVQPSGQPTPTALVNNMNAPRLAYVMQGGIGSTRQVVVTSAPAPIRPAPAIRTSYPLSGTITNGTVRVIPMSSTATIQVCKHPAALPESLNSPSNPSWKLPPPAPSLKISKVANGIVLSWNMALSEKYADIASYQLYAYQEVIGIAPSSTLWKKVGDVRALPLPMACTLTQFSEGNNYYFAVRAVDKHSRLGMYSQPGNISL